MGRLTITVQGMNFELNIGEYYIIHYYDEEISFHGLESVIEDTHWKDDKGRTMFFIWVPEHQEDYLISDKEIRSISKLSTQG